MHVNKNNHHNKTNLKAHKSNIKSKIKIIFNVTIKYFQLTKGIAMDFTFM